MCLKKAAILYKHFFMLKNIAFFSMALTTAMAQAQAPVPAKKPFVIETHGDKRTDDYYWMNQYWLKGPDSAEVVKYLTAENDFYNKENAHTTQFQENLFKEIVGRIKQTDQSVPYFKNGYWYITKYEEGKEYPIYTRKKGSLTAAEEVLIDANEMAKEHKYFAVGSVSVSTNNTILAFTTDVVSRRKYTLYFKDLTTGKLLADKIENTSGSVTWANDNKTVFFSQINDTTLRSEKIMRYQLGGKNADLVFHETDETFNAGVYKTKSEAYIFVASYSTLSSEFRYVDANNPTKTFTVIQPRQKDFLYDVDHYGTNFYILTNWNAQNFRLMKTPVTNTVQSNWKEVIAHRENTLLEGIEIFKDYLVLSERRNAATHIRIMPWSNKGEHYLAFDEPAYVAGVGFNPEFNTKTLRFSYQSMTTPSSTYDYDMAAKTKKLLKQQEVLGGYNAADYTTERLWAKADDGTEIPISIVYKKGFQKNGKQPLLLYGYGSYGASMDPSFSSARLSLLNRGFAYAIAHIRGGQEMGRQWYLDGKMFKKKNTFTDFINCAEYLVKNNYTTPQHLYANGGSAGGLLMGAVVNMRPDLWNGIVAAVPFVDVVTTMLDESIPLTTGEFDEWGNPKNSNSYFYMKSYSPYDNVERKNYPNMLVTTGLHDSQVQYFEPAKWVAKLREYKTDKNKLYLHTNMDAGHGGASGRFQRLKEIARDYAFFLDLEGINK